MIRLDFTNVFADAVKGGVTEEEFYSLESKASEAVEKIVSQIERKELGYANLVNFDFTEDFARTVELAEVCSQRFRDLVVVGIGGSALGARAVDSALMLSSGSSYGLRERNFYVLDNVDPEFIFSVFESLDLDNTCFNVVTKSGSTAETLSVFLFVYDLYRKGRIKKEQIVITTDPEKGFLRKLAEEEGFASLAVPPEVGGRFSVLSPVGLFPSAFLGADVKAMIEGAREMHSISYKKEFYESPSLTFGALMYLLRKLRGISQLVLMPYSSALYLVADWFRQLWAESLGKKFSVKKEVVYEGQTPIKALGATDQHSQIQLYREGPFDKVVVFMRVNSFRKDDIMPPSFETHLSGKSLGDLLNAEQLATEMALKKAGRLNMRIELPRIDEKSLGQLFYFFEVATVFYAYLAGIDPFNQPGVEEGKRITHAMMGKEGMEDYRGEVARYISSRRRVLP